MAEKNDIFQNLTNFKINILTIFQKYLVLLQLLANILTIKKNKILIVITTLKYLKIVKQIQISIKISN